jgi:thymidylate synthase (FAD)
MIDPLNDGISSVALIQHIGGDNSVVAAARVSLGSDDFEREMDSRDKKLIEYLLKNKHGSPFEHNLITFKIVCPIFVDRQMVRHRVGVSKNEISGRYVEMTERVYIPAPFRQQAKENRQASVEADSQLNQRSALLVYRRAWTEAYSAYQELLKLGVTREQARGVLPQALYTESYYTFNLRSLFHFIGLRDHTGAQHETQMYARAMRELAAPLFPVCFAAFDSLGHD